MAYIDAFGSHLPARRVGNEEIAPLVGATPEWILSVSGIEERRYAAAEETVASLGLAAAKNCLANAGVEASQLGMILVSSGSSDRFAPGPAAQIAAGLGLASTPALDIPVPSAGSLIALALAADLAPRYGLILVVGAEIMSRRIDRTSAGKDTAILFGDGAGAALVDANLHAQSGFLRIADSLLSTDGASAEILKIENNRLLMDGRSVILQAYRKMPRAIHDLLARNALAASDVGVFLLHQANLNLIEKVATGLKGSGPVLIDRFFVNIARYGNTSSASLLIAADEWRRAHPEPPTAPIVFSAFGAGLNWGALLALPI
jgi:3-oxoacyl-[acyl-carrier-protein] synthase-3